MKVTTKQISDKVSLFSVSNGTMSFSAMNFGCVITNLIVPDKNGNPVDVVLGLPELKDYEAEKDSLGAVVGRFANRIKNASFTIDGTTYNLDKNEGENCLHGGFSRFEKKIWEAFPFEEEDKAGIIFKRTSPEDEQHFPGNCIMEVSYALNSKNQLLLSYKATSDKTTPINLTNHSYFNLAGKGEVFNHELTLESKEILEVDDSLIPTGKLIPTSGTIFDFSKAKKIGDDIRKINKKINGYDHCFVTKARDTHKLEYFGTAFEPSTGISMSIMTDQPGVQIYTANFLTEQVGKNNEPLKHYYGICFETQHFPDAPNNPEFPNCLIKPGETYNHQAIFEFKTLK